MSVENARSENFTKPKTVNFLLKCSAVVGKYRKIKYRHIHWFLFQQKKTGAVFIVSLFAANWEPLTS